MQLVSEHIHNTVMSVDVQEVVASSRVWVALEKFCFEYFHVLVHFGSENMLLKYGKSDFNDLVLGV